MGGGEGFWHTAGSFEVKKANPTQKSENFQVEQGKMERDTEGPSCRTKAGTDNQNRKPTEYDIFLHIALVRLGRV